MTVWLRTQSSSLEREAELKLAIGARAGKATISLRTDGSSIAARDLRALFNPFKKSRVTRPGVESGTALAFAKVKRIIEVHGGAMRVQGGKGKEWTIQLTLPLAQPALRNVRLRTKLPAPTKIRTQRAYLTSGNFPSAGIFSRITLLRLVYAPWPERASSRDSAAFSLADLAGCTSREQMPTQAQSKRAVRANRGATDRAVLQIASRVSAAIGEEFFRSVTEHLAEALQADCVYIGEFLGGQVERVKTAGGMPGRRSRKASNTNWQAAPPHRPPSANRVFAGHKRRSIFPPTRYCPSGTRRHVSESH